MIKFLLILLMIYIIYRYYKNNVYEGMTGSLVYPNYVPNTSMKFYDNIIPFDIDYMCQDKKENRYLGWPCWWRKNASNYCVKYPKIEKRFENYLRNTPLKYDGIWDKKCDNDFKKCYWKMDKKMVPVC